MASPNTKKRRFIVSNPGAELSRFDAIQLIHRHAEWVRVFEDLSGHQALMVTDQQRRRLVLFTDLSDEQIHAELPEAWRREHAQADLFDNLPDEVGNNPDPKRIRGHWFSRIWQSLTRGM